MHNVIFSHHTKADEARIQSLSEKILALYPSECKLTSVIDFKPWLRSRDKWEQWIELLVRDADTFIISTLRIGKATMKAANLMKVKGKRVLFFNGEELKQVKFIREMDPSNWKQGWMVIYS